VSALARETARRQLTQRLAPAGLYVDTDGSSDRVVVRRDDRLAFHLQLGAHGEISALETPLGRRFELEFDRHRLTRLCTPRGHAVHISYGASGEPKLVRRGAAEMRLGYDDATRLTSIVGPNGASSRLAYDGSDLLAGFTDPVGHVETYEHDNAGRLTAIVDPRGFRTEFGYGAWVAPDTITRPDGTVERYERDAEGRVRATTIGDTPGAKATWDEAGRLRRAEYVDAPTVAFEYDPAGRLTKAAAGDHVVEYRYDDRGRLSGEIQDGQKVGYGYDDDDRLVAITLPTGEPIGYEYDLDGRLTAITDWDGRRHAFRYLGEAVVEHRAPNGVVTRSAYAPDGRVAESIARRGADEVLSLRCRYDAAGQVVQREVNGLQQSYAYDAAGQLLSVRQPGDGTAETFEYDPAGNLARVNGIPLEHDAVNRTQSFGVRRFAYDTRGNRIAQREGSTACQYDFNGRNQLVRVRRADGGEVVFRYDAFGRRVMKVSGRVTTRYVWLGNLLLSETLEHESGEASRNDYLFLPNSFWPVSARLNGVPYQYHCDQIGTPHELTDPQGSVAWSATYSAFGAAKVAPGSIVNPIRFAGQYFDEETALHYSIARYFDPVLGRYLSRDPLTYLGGLNFYTYAGNDPVNAVDPLGLLTLTPRWLRTVVAGVTAAAVGVLVGIATAPFLGPGAIIAGGAAAGAVFAGIDSYMTDGCVTCALGAAGKGAIVGGLAAIPFALLPATAGVVMFAGAGLVSGEIGYVANWALTPGARWDNDEFVQAGALGALLGGASRVIGRAWGRWQSREGLPLVEEQPANYTAQSEQHIQQRNHAPGGQQAVNAGRSAQQGRTVYDSKFATDEGGQAFADEVMQHPRTNVETRNNGRQVYTNDDLGRVTGLGEDGRPVRGGTVVAEGNQPAQGRAPRDVVTQFPSGREATAAETVSPRAGAAGTTAPAGLVSGNADRGENP
jgi:RHS repeat-associated protein